MKKVAVVILFLVLAMLIGGCYRKVDLKPDKDGAIIYNGIRYVKDSDFGVMFRLNYENPEYVGTSEWWYLYPRYPKAYFSEFDTEKNILFREFGPMGPWVKEGYKLPNPYECRINKIVAGYEYVVEGIRKWKEYVIWEAEEKFLTLNDMMGEKADLSSPNENTHNENIHLDCYLEDYKYLIVVNIWVFWRDEKAYFAFPGKAGYFTVKSDYAQYFRVPSAE